MYFLVGFWFLLLFFFHYLLGNSAFFTLKYLFSHIVYIAITGHSTTITIAFIVYVFIQADQGKY